MRKIPTATAKRLPIYYKCVCDLHKEGKQKVLSSELSEMLQIDSATIRKDFSFIGELGRQGFGYRVEDLVSIFKDVLRQSGKEKVALVGVGNLGRALLNYKNFYSNDIIICEAFDSDPSKVGQIVAGIQIKHIDELENLDDTITTVILAIPESFADNIVTKLEKTNIEGILNFSGKKIVTSEERHIEVLDIDITVQLQTLIFFAKLNKEKDNDSQTVID